VGGRVAERDDTFGAIAFSSFRFDEQIELGIETATGDRRQGLAAAVAARMIADALLERLTPVYACREGNVGSARLARKLGFVPTRTLPYFRLLAR
jgi:RimJ/RimL family protein N-acetyltransferase